MEFLRRAEGKMAKMEGDTWELPEHMQVTLVISVL
jgi:hypothetical protein